MYSTMSSSTNNVVIGHLLCSDTSSYVVMGILGEGAFGKVAKCFCLDTAEMVAIKFLDANDKTIAQEVEMLKAISVFDSDKKNLVKFIDCFSHKGLFCMVFEMLDQSMFQLIRTRNLCPLSLNEIRPVVHQLLVSLEALKSLNIIHGDLKTDNIMLVHQENQPFKIRLIDFGLAIQASEAEVGGLLQHPGFRAPEIMLGLPLTEAVDIWSLGCIMTSLVFSSTPFSGECYYGWMENLVSMWGEPEDHLLAAGEYTTEYFVSDESEWRLMTPKEFHNVHQHRPEPERDRSGFLYFKKNFENYLFSMEQDELEHKDKLEFFDLLNCCLQVDPKERISPSEALRHPFITMVHMVHAMETSSYADTALELMCVSPLDNLDDSPANTVTSEDSSSASSRAGSAIALVDTYDISACGDKPFTTKPFQRIRHFFHRVGERAVRMFKPAK